MRAPGRDERMLGDVVFFVGWMLICTHFGWVESWTTFWQSGVWWGGQLMSGLFGSYSTKAAA